MYQPMFHLAPVSAMIFLALDNYRMDALIFILLSFWHLITEIVLVFCCSVLRLFSSSCFIIRFYSFDKLYLKNLPLLLPQPDSYFMHSNFLKFDRYCQAKEVRNFFIFFSSSFFVIMIQGLMSSDVGLTYYRPFFFFFRSLATYTYV